MSAFHIGDRLIVIRDTDFPTGWRYPRGRPVGGEVVTVANVLNDGVALVERPALIADDINPVCFYDGSRFVPAPADSRHFED